MPDYTAASSECGERIVRVGVGCDRVSHSLLHAFTFSGITLDYPAFFYTPEDRAL
jgi:hypothetical protein